ncbi:MAG: TylF/MycF/NovP-related O-methyltransferase [Armatimonadota bacterium]
MIENECSNAVEYKPTGAAAVAKAVLPALKKIMPEKIYNVFFDTLHKTYRLLLRYGYLGKYISAKLSGDKVLAAKRSYVYRLLPFTLTGQKGLESSYDIVMMAEDSSVDGDIVECGVAQGGCAAIMALASRSRGSDRKMWFFDSYEGLPDPTEDDFQEGKTGQHVRPLPKGACLGTIEQVQDVLFNKCGLKRENISLVKGWFENTLPVTKDQIKSIAVLRLDGDWYESTRCCLINLYDTVSSGGFVIIDDYGTCFGAKKAVDEFRAERGITSALKPDGRGGCWFCKD